VLTAPLADGWRPHLECHGHCWLLDLDGGQGNWGLRAAYGFTDLQHRMCTNSNNVRATLHARGGGAFGLLCSACTLTTLAACAACNCLSPSYHLTHEPSRISTGHALTGHAATPVDTFSKALTKGTGRVLNEVDECHCGVCSDYRFSRSRMMHTAVKDEKSTAVSVEVRGPAWSAACRWCEALHGQRVGARHCMVSWGAGDTSLPATLL
jgi:hypothetical protein